ncbi:BatD family protein [Photobacterium swingsii]
MVSRMKNVSQSQHQVALFSGIASLARSYALRLLLGVCALLSVSVHAAQVEATVSKNIVAVNEVFQLVIAIDSNVNPNSLDLSALEDNFTYGRPSVSSNNSYTNGTLSSSTQWRIAIAAKKVGNITIPSFRIGATASEPIELQVLKSANATTSNEPNIKLSSSLDKPSLYVGESAQLTVRILIAEQLDQAALIAPEAEGIDIVQQGEDKQAERILNGRRYIEITRQYQLTPFESGDIVLKGAQFKTSIVKGSRGFGSTLSVPFEKQAENITLTVKPKPKNYQGLWLPTADLQLEQTWQPSSTTARVGDPITRTLTLSIKNVAQSSMPNLNIDYPRSVRVYSEKPIYSQDNGYTRMVIKQVIIPREVGSLALPPLAVNWWNTQSNQQQTTRVEGLAIDVKEGDLSNSVQLPILNDPSVQTTNDTARPVEVKTVKDAGVWPWLTAIVTSLWLLTTGFWLKARQRNLTQVPSPQHAGHTRNATPTTDEQVFAHLLAAVKANQPIQVQSYYQQWQRSDFQASYIAQVDNEINAMMKAHYSTDSHTWDNQALIKLLEKANKQRHQASTQSALAPLIPSDSNKKQ